MDRLFTLGEAAELLGTPERFPRLLLAERRIAFVRVGRHVRIAESVLRAYVEENTVDVVRYRGRSA